MKIAISKCEVILTGLVIYFTSKILWDRLVPSIFELISVGLLLYGAVRFFKDNRIKGKIKFIFITYVIFCLYIIINALFQDTPQQFARAMYEYCFYGLMFFGTSYYVGKCCLVKILKVVNVWGVFISMLSWYEFLSKSYILPNNFKTTILHSHAFRATVFTRSYLSHAMVLAFFSIIAMYLYFENKKIRYMISYIFCTVSVLTTSSRGPLVALILTILFFFVMNILKKGATPDKKVFIFFGILFVILMGVLFLNSTFVTGNNAVDYFLYRMRQIVNWSGDPGNVGRIGTWLWSMELFESNILFGIGPSHTGSWGSGSIGVTESGWLKYLCELGVIGFILVLMLLISIIDYGKKKYSLMSQNEKLEMIFFFSLILLVMINNITLQSSEEIQVNFIWALGLGGVLSKKKVMFR